MIPGDGHDEMQDEEGDSEDEDMSEEEVYVYVCMYVCMYIYIERERERERMTSGTTRPCRKGQRNRCAKPFAHFPPIFCAKRETAAQCCACCR